MFKTLTLIVALVGMLASSAVSANEEIIRSYRSVRSLGMGGARITTGIYDDALFSNPAMHREAETWKVSILNFSAETNSNFIQDVSKVGNVKDASGTGVLTQLSEQGLYGRNEHLRLSNVSGVYMPHLFGGLNALSIGLLVNSQTNLMLRSTAEVDAQLITDVGPAVGFARSFMDETLDVGINVRAIYRLASDQAISAVDFLSGKSLKMEDIAGQGAGIDGDLGVFYHIPVDLKVVKFSAGASIDNIAASTYSMKANFIKNISSLPPKNDRSFNLGVRADFPEFVVFKNTQVAVEMQDIGSQSHLVSTWKRVHVGGETTFLRVFAARVGLNQGYFTAGVGVNLPLLKIDAVTYGEELGSNIGMLQDRRYAVRLGIEI